jgi:hypothetical protein
MELRKLAKSRKEQALEAVHKSPEELQAMAEEYGGAVGSVAKVAGPAGRAVGNIATHIEGESLRGLLRRMKNPELTKKADEFINLDIPLKEKNAGVKRMVEMLREKLKKR